MTAGLAFTIFQICEPTVPATTSNKRSKPVPMGNIPTPEWKAKKLSKKLEIIRIENTPPNNPAIPQIIR